MPTTTPNPTASCLRRSLALAALCSLSGCSFLISGSDETTEPPPPAPAEAAVIDPATTIGPQSPVEPQDQQPVVGVWTDAEGAGWILTINTDGTYTNVSRREASTDDDLETKTIDINAPLEEEPPPAIDVFQGSWTYEAGILQLRRESPSVEQLPPMLYAKTTTGRPALTDQSDRVLWLLASPPSRPTANPEPTP